MRTREEILESRRQTLRNCTEASYWHTKQSATQEAMLEVLLDIRAILSGSFTAQYTQQLKGQPPPAEEIEGVGI